MNCLLSVAVLQSSKENILKSLETCPDGELQNLLPETRGLYIHLEPRFRNPHHIF
jgi:hypothetical protein